MKSVRLTLMATLALMSLTPHEAFSQGTYPESAYTGIDDSTLFRLRENFSQAAGSMEATLSAIAFLDARFPHEANSQPAITKAYRASLTGLTGKHASGLIEKFNRVNDSIKAWENLVEQHPGSLEIRFLRYAFFSQLPAIFKVGNYVKPDLAALLELLESNADDRVPHSQRNDMIAWLLSEGKLSPAERQRVEALR